ncbi:MAG: c-type cytochrome [Alphaproteobacteria bacterium]
MIRKTTLLTAALLALALGGPAARADHVSTPTPEMLAGADKQAGKKFAKACAQCHGADGMAAIPGAPHLAGQHAGYLAIALDSYLDGVRKGPAMRESFGGWGEQDIINVAVYFASLPPFSEAQSASAGDEAAVADPFAEAKAAADACAACHGEDGNSEIPGMPSVAGQPSKYLETALKAYRDGRRAHDVMNAYTLSLSDPEIALLAAYYEAADPKTYPAETPAADLAAGAAVAAPCSGCHGADGNSDDPTAPRLAGLDAEYLAIAIKAYKEKTRDHATMTEFVASLGEAEVRNVAAFYATRKAKRPEPPARMGPAEWAERCDRCHGKDGYGGNPRFPILAGQSASYLASALRVYHAGARKNSIMHAMSFPLGEADFRSLAAYYAGKRRR